MKDIHHQGNNMSKREMLQALHMEIEKQQNIDDPAWQATITTLENAWLAKFGSEWVDGAMLVNDPFFSVAAQRLVFDKKLERHLLMSRSEPVYRIVE